MEGTELTLVEPAKGECEVVPYSPRHDGTWADESVRHIRNLIRVWKDRYQELGSREEIQYVLIFENKGEARRGYAASSSRPDSCLSFHSSRAAA